MFYKICLNKNIYSYTYKNMQSLSKKNNDNFSKYNDLGLTGLGNLGNTCWINSALQCLSHTYEINEFLDDQSYKKRLNVSLPDSALIVEWDNLRKLIWSENCTISPGGFLQAIRKIAHTKEKIIFTGFAQNDFQEFILFIIDCFHNSMKREVIMNIKGNVMNQTDKLAKQCYEMMSDMYKKEYSEFLTLFFGIHVSQIKSLDDSILSYKPEPFFMLDLPIPKNSKNITLFDCIDLYLESERLDGDNSWYNEKTKEKQPVNKGIILWSLPNILIISFKRFTNDNKKNQSNINFEINNVDFKKYISGYNSNTYVYDLYGICNHFGGVGGGHYSAYVKNNNNKWYHFNDTNVSEIDKSKIITESAYCLFYRKKK